MSETAIIPLRAEVVRAEDFMPLMTVAQAVQRKQQINQFISEVLKVELDYGVIPGGQQKPVLLKPGAEKLCSIFGLAPCYEAEQVVEDWTGADHAGELFFYYRYKCRLIRGDRSMGEAVGSANSFEAKYRWREQRRVCPTCGKDAIIAGKAEWGGGWLCWKKKNGCGAKFEPGDKAIVDQPAGRIPNPDVADQVNTIQKMAQKRALVAAVLVVTNCSDAFTQDLEDIDTGGHPHGTQAAADAVAERKVAQARASTPDEVPAELRKLVNDLPRKGGPDALFDHIRAAIEKVGDKGALRAHDARMEAWGAPFVAAGKVASLDQMQTQAIIEWNELTNLRQAKSAEHAAAEDSQFAVSK